jgi:hypothetical protein
VVAMRFLLMGGWIVEGSGAGPTHGSQWWSCGAQVETFFYEGRNVIRLYDYKADPDNLPNTTCGGVGVRVIALWWVMLREAGASGAIVGMLSHSWALTGLAQPSGAWPSAAVPGLAWPGQ